MLIPKKSELQKSYAEALGSLKNNIENNEVISSINQNLISVKQNMEINAILFLCKKNFQQKDKFNTLL